MPVPQNAVSIILTAITTANLIERKLPGTYQSTITDVYEYNNMPNVKLPPNIIDQLIYVFQESQQEGEEESEPNMDTDTDVFRFPARPALDAHHIVTKANETETKVSNLSMPELSDADPEHPYRVTAKRTKKKLNKRQRTRTRSESNEPESRPVSEVLAEQNKNKSKTDQSILLSALEDGNLDQSTNQNRNEDQPLEEEHPCSGNTNTSNKDKALQKIKDMGISIYYPQTWQKPDGTLDTVKALDTLIKSTLSMTYKKGIAGISPRTLVIKCHQKGLNMSQVLSFVPLTKTDYERLCEGHWSVVGVHSDSEGV